MDSRPNDSLVRRVVGRAAHRGLRVLGAHTYLASVRTAHPSEFVREAAPQGLLVDQGGASGALLARLGGDEVRQVERRIHEDADLAQKYAAAPDDVTRRRLLVAFGAWLGSSQLAERTGLSRAEPPSEVHAMARGPLAAAGGLDEADMIVDALMSAGVEIGSLSAALDFGSSSGRVVRVLAAAFPEIHWRACDPNEPAIAWARENLGGIEFFVSPQAPPLPLPGESQDLICAISIWSHFGPRLGIRWFEEMRRVIRPGGWLVCTTHGLTSLATYATRKLRTADQSREIAESLYSRGWWYAQEFGPQGDWGIVNAQWGSTFLSPEWMLTQLCPMWRVVEFAPGRLQNDQDVYVLQRV
jgi:hypothetical protein